tara:strand:+ start:434 stop:2809 length:2376 start_codon:yes stop_codon:yes gene_type:complete
MSGAKKRLVQDLLQRRASNIIFEPTVRAQIDRFRPPDINRLRLLESQRLAGQVPISEKLKKQQKKKKKRARKTKQLRGDLARNLTEQRRFIKGERRDKDTEEPRIVGDPKPVPVGAAYDPEIERRKLDIQQATIDQNRLDRITDRAEGRRRQDAELAVRRGELAAGRAERALIRAAIPPPAPPAAAPVINIAAPPPAQVRVEGPTINLPAREDADPIPEIQRLGAELRADTNAYGQEQDERNRRSFQELRAATELDNRQSRQLLETIEARQQAQDENRRADILRQDAIYQQFEERLGAGERALSDGRSEVLREIRAAEDRLTGAQIQLNTPTTYDEVILQQVDDAVREGLSAGSPRSLRLEPVTPIAEPEFSGGRIAGGGELELPDLVIDAPGAIEPEPTSQEFQQQLESLAERSTTGRLREQISQRLGTTEEDELDRVLATNDPVVAQQYLDQRSRSMQRARERTEGGFELPGDAERLRLSPSPLASPVAERSEEEEGSSGRLRLTSTQEFLSGFARPQVEPVDRVIEPSGIQALEPALRADEPSPQERPLRELDPDVLFEAVEEADEVGQVQDPGQQRIRESNQLYEGSFEELTSQVRPGPRASHRLRGGMGYRVRNNTDRRVKKVEPGDVVDVIGVESGDGRGLYRLDTQTAAGTRVKLDQLGPLINDGSLLFERGSRHELGGHFDEQPYGAPPQEVGLLQQGAEAAGGAAAAVVGGAGRLAGGLALGAAQGVAEQLPTAGDVGAALGRGAVGAVTGAGRLAAGAVGAIVGGGEEEQEAPQPTLSSDE